MTIRTDEKLKGSKALIGNYLFSRVQQFNFNLKYVRLLGLRTDGFDTSKECLNMLTLKHIQIMIRANMF